MDQGHASGADRPEDTNRFAPPRADVADVPDPDGGQLLASRGRRLAAAIVDVVIMLVVLGVVSAVTSWNPFATGSTNVWAAAPANALSGFVVFMLVNGYTLVTRGQTLGKIALGVRIVRTDGTRASAAQLIGMRYGLFALPNLLPAIGQLVGLVNVLFIFHESRRCLHDRVAGTIVVKA
jgi:uncharacterized RDD family membrane protein YckC